MASVVAATAATGCPGNSALSRAITLRHIQRMSWMPSMTAPFSIVKSTMSFEVTTAFTPGSFSALDVSIDLMRACGCGLRSTLPQIMPGMVVSAANWARPVTLSIPSGRMVRWPIHLLLVTRFIGLAPVNLLSAHFGGGVHHRADDLVVAGAPAEVAGEPEADFLLGRVRAPLEQRVGSHQHAGRADAALKRGHFQELLLQGMQLVALRHAFDGA